MRRGRRAAAADRDERTCDEMPTAAGAERKADTPQKDACDPNTATAATALSSFAVLFVLDEGLAFTCCSRLAVVISQYLWSGKIRHFLDEFLQVEKTQSYWSKRNNYREQCERAIGQWSEGVDAARRWSPAPRITRAWPLVEAELSAC